MSAHVVATQGEIFAWSGPLEAVVQRADGAAALSWSGWPLATARWDGQRLTRFQLAGPSPKGGALRGALEGIEAALRGAWMSPPAPRPRPATWSCTEEVGELLRGIRKAHWLLPLPPAALVGPTPIAAVMIALSDGIAAASGVERAVLEAVLAAVDEVVEASAQAWVMPASAPSPTPTKAKRSRALKPRVKRPKKVKKPKRIRFAETWF